MLKFRPLLLLLFVLAFSGSAFADQVYVTYSSSTKYKALIPDVHQSLNSGTSTLYDISIHNSQNAYYFVKVTKVGSLNSSAIPDYFLLMPHETYSLPRSSFKNGDSLALVADGSLNNWQVPTLLACDALYRALQGTAPPRSIQEGFFELAKKGIEEAGPEEAGLANNLLSFQQNAKQGDVFGAVHDLYDIGKDPLVEKLGFPKMPWWVSFLAGAGSVIELEIETLLAPHVDVLTFDGTYIGNSSPPPVVQPPTPSFTDNSKYVADVNVPDGSVFPANQGFVKTWRIRNTGTSSWGTGYRWTYNGGAKLGGPDSIAVPSIAPNATWDPSVSLRAPAGAGTYRGYWQLQAPNGQKFGEQVWVEIRVYGAGGAAPAPSNGYDSSHFLTDVTIADGTVIGGAQSFTKTWRLRNTGTRTWGAGYKWVFDGGVQMGGPDSIDVPAVSPGANWDASVSLVAPSSAGTYKGFWRMQDPGGTKFGDQVWVTIKVNGAPNPNITTYVSETDWTSQEGTPGFFRHGTAGYWKDATGFGDGNHMLWTYNNDAAHGTDDIGDWRPNLPETRLYEVLVYIPRNFGTTRQAKYQVFHADGETDRIVDQFIYSDKWVSLGTYRFNSGSSNYVRLIDETDEGYLTKMVGFDACKWEARDEPVAPPAITTYVSESAAAPSADAPGFWRDGPAQYWHDGYNVGDGGHVLWTQNNSEAQGVQNSGSWRPNLPSGGTYQVYVFVPSNFATTRNARYEIHHADGETDVPVYQLVYKDEWVSVGTFRFDAGSANYVRLVDVTSEGAQTTQIGFDSVKWEKRDDPLPTLSTTIVRETDAASADGAAGFWRHGTASYWHDVSGIGLDDHMLWTKNNDAAHGIDDMGDWRPDLPQLAKYEVFVYIPHNYATTRDAHYEIYHADGRTNVTVDQLSRNDEWVSLGTYRFNAGTGGFLRLIDQTGEGYITTKLGFDSAKWERRPANASAPSNLQPSADAITGKSVTFSWQDNGMDDGNPSANFQVQVWKVINGNRDALVWTSDWQPGTSRGWDAPDPGEYEWIVAAGNGVSQSAASATARFIVPVPQPEDPTELTATALDPHRISVAWTDNSKDESGFKIESMSPGADWADLGTVDTDVTSYIATGLNSNTLYTFRVVAVGAGGDSTFSNEASAQTPVDYSLSTLTVDPTFVVGGQAATGQIALAGPSKAGGTLISLTSSSPDVTVPATVTVPEAATVITFPVTTKEVFASGNATITAAFSGATLTTTLAVGKSLRPHIVSLSPASGRTDPQLSRSFTAVYGKGASEINETYMLVNATVSGANGLYGFYNPISNLLYLRDNANSAWLGGFAPGSNNVITNSQGSLNCAQTTVSRNGDNLTVNWTFTPSSSFVGAKNLFLFVHGTTGGSDGWTDKGDWLIQSNVAPQNLSASPSSGHSILGAARLFSVVYSDANGANDLKDVFFIAQTAAAGNASLFVWYNPSSNKLYLRDDANANWLGGFAPGSGNLISNGQGTLNCAQTSVAVAGNKLIVNWALTPKTNYVGAKNLWALCRDNSGASDGWDDLGDWLIQANVAPVNISISPSAGRTSPGATRVLSLVCSDGNGEADLNDVYLIAQASPTGSNSLFVWYNRASNKIYLRDDGNLNWLGGFAPSSNNVISNNQGSLSCALTTVTGAGNNLTLKLSLTPALAYIGAKNLWVQCRDTSGASDGWDDMGDWLIQANVSPTNVSATPAIVSSDATYNRNFSVVYSDGNGAGDLTDAYFLAQTAAGGLNTLYAWYNRADNKLYLRDNANTSWLGGFAPGSNNVISNSQGSLNCALVTVNAVGNNLTVNWAMTPAVTYVGNKNVWTYCRDSGGATDGWDDLGDWSIHGPPALPPSPMMAAAVSAPRS